jgi:hypothetical protein
LLVVKVPRSKLNDDGSQVITKSGLRANVYVRGLAANVRITDISIPATVLTEDEQIIKRSGLLTPIGIKS